MQYEIADIFARAFRQAGSKRRDQELFQARCSVAVVPSKHEDFMVAIWLTEEDKPEGQCGASALDSGQHSCPMIMQTLQLSWMSVEVAVSLCLCGSGAKQAFRIRSRQRSTHLVNKSALQRTRSSPALSISSEPSIELLLLTTKTRPMKRSDKRSVWRSYHYLRTKKRQEVAKGLPRLL